MSINEHVAIIGGGIIGMMSAYYLHQKGYQITIIDKSDIAKESTWAGGGILSPLYPWKYPDEVNQLAAFSQIAYPEISYKLQEVSDISPEYFKTGLLVDQNEMNDEAMSWLQRNNLRYFALERSAAQLNSLNKEKRYGLFPELANIRNPRLAKALKKYLEVVGVQIKPNFEVSELRQVQNGHLSLRLSQSRVGGLSQAWETFDKVVVCAGAWTAKLLKNTGISLPIRPIRGQMLLFRSNPGFLKSILLAQGNYAIPRMDGRILVGSTMEDVGFDKSTTSKAFDQLKHFIEEYIPELLYFEIEKQWSGLRPSSPRGIPYIGPHPDIDNLYINSGHFRNGVVLAPASGKLLSDILSTRNSFVNPENYNFENFTDLLAVS